MSIVYQDLLAEALQSLSNAEPDGVAARQALLLAAHTGLRRADGPGAVDWDFYTLAVTRALADLQAGLADQVVLTPEVPAPGPDNLQLRHAATSLVRALADLYATTAAVPGRPVWRRLVWAAVALRLDEAVAQLT